jgi:hypothetical protein
MDNIDTMILKFQRVGERNKAKWLETIDQKIPPSFKERIKNNDKSITRELILPEWVTWDLLRQWALEESTEEQCTACHNVASKFVVFKNAIICDECMDELRKLKP